MTTEASPCTCGSRGRLHRFPQNPCNRQGLPERQYSAELVERVRELYAGGMSMIEVASATGTSTKVLHRLMPRAGIARRPAIKREQRGPANSNWTGIEAGYNTMHRRVEALRGKPQRCELCDQAEGIFDWANVSGRYSDSDDYARLCRSCHIAYDTNRRKATGARTMPASEIRARSLPKGGSR